MIDKFDGEYRWLSNFFGVWVALDGERYDTVEHAFQAAKTEYPEERKRIQSARTPVIAKMEGPV